MWNTEKYILKTKELNYKHSNKQMCVSISLLPNFLYNSILNLYFTANLRSKEVNYAYKQQAL